MNLPGPIADRLGDRRLIRVEDGQSGATVFRTDDEGCGLYLKIGEGVAAELVADEIVRLRWLAGRVPAARLVESVEGDAAVWLLTEALPGVPIGSWIKRDRRRATQAARVLADFVRQLQALPPESCPFDSSVQTWLPIVRNLVAQGRVEVEDFDPDHAGWSAGEVLAHVERLACHSQGRAIVHGDLSLGNLIVDDAGKLLGCIDVGRLGVGDPYRDIFIGWRDLGGFGEDAQRAFLTALDLDKLDDARRDLHRALDELF